MHITGNIKERGVKQKVNVHFVQEKFQRKTMANIHFQKVFMMQ